MKTINSVELQGRLGADPELRTFDNGTSVARVSLAIDESWKDKKSGEWKKNTHWIRLVFWNDLAKQVADTYTKGVLINISGKLSTNRYTSKDGIEKTIIEIVVLDIKEIVQ